MDESALDSLKAAGAPPEILEQKRAELQQLARMQDIEVWPEHCHAMDVFFAMSTQWNIISSMAGSSYTGLKYEVLDLVESRLALDPTDPDAPDAKTRFAQIRILERAALGYLNQRD